MEAMSEITSRVHSVNVSMDNAINITPLATVYPTAAESKKGQPSNAIGSEGKYEGKLSNPNLNKIMEDGRDVERAIRNLVYRVLHEDVHVDGISRPLSQIAHPTHADIVGETPDNSNSNDAAANLLALY